MNFSYISYLYKKEEKKYKFDNTYTFLIFPYKKIPFGELILKYSLINNVDPHLITCIIFAESAFDETAISLKGAVGLMQFLVLDEESWDRHKDPSFNLEISILHLKYLFDVFEGDLLNTIASYNCGINCLKERKKLPMETIYFTQKVLNCYYEIWSKTPDITFPFNFCKE